jgi:putative aminopeptidase FrvX
MPLLLLFLVLNGAAQPQQLQFSLVDRATILDRVKQSLPKNERREEEIKQLFAAAGCSAAMAEQPVKHLHTPNVICRLQGEIDDEIIVGAHYDKVSSGTGTIDNWSGAALLPSLYQGLAWKKPHHTFIFVAFAGEEEGLVGSEYFVKHMPPDELARTEAMINMDTLGLSYTRVWVHRADRNLVQELLAVSASMKLPVGEVDVENVGSTDSESFADKHVPRITIHSVTQESLRVLHSPADTLQQLHPDEYYDTYRLMQAYLAYLDLNWPRPQARTKASRPEKHDGIEMAPCLGWRKRLSCETRFWPCKIA